MRCLFLFLAFVFFLFYSSSAFADRKNTKVIWESKIRQLNISGHTDVWQYQKDRLNKAGSSEALFFLPSSSRPDDLTVIFWFHGCGGYSERTFDIRLALQLKKLEDRNHSYAIVVPELLWSKNTTTSCSRQGRSFRKPGTLVSFVNDSLTKINEAMNNSGKETSVNPRLVFIGHSAGGSVIKAASVSGDLCKIKPAEVVWSDSTYGRWLDTAWRRCLSKGGSSTVVLVRKWTKTWKNLQRFMKRQSPKDFLRVKPYGGKIYHKTIGDNAIEFSEVFSTGC